MWKGVRGLVPLQFPQVVDQTESKEKQVNAKYSCALPLIFSCFVHFQILTFTAVVMFYLYVHLLFIQNGISSMFYQGYGSFT